MDFFEHKVKETINKYNMLSPDDSVIVGLSGGADSVSLLLVLKNLNYNVIAVHVNHMIRSEEAIRDQEFSSDLCKKNGIPFVCYTKNIPVIAKKDGISEELAGRNVRYECFKEAAKLYNASRIAVAHNMNDCVETMLFNIMRGSGMAGACGIPPVNEAVIRPLINISRDEIEAYLSSLSVQYVCDSTNNENIYSRNIIRNKILPLFGAVNASYIRNAKRCADIIREENEYIKRVTNRYIEKNCTLNAGSVMLKLDKDEDIVIIKRAVIYCLNRLSFFEADLSSHNIDDILSLKTGKKIVFGNNFSIVREYDTLIMSCEGDDFPDYQYPVSLCQQVYIRETDEFITFEMIKSHGDVNYSDENSSYVDLDKLGFMSVRNRREGDRFVPSGMDKSKKLKDFFIDTKTPRHLRKTVPLFCSDNEIAAIVGIRTDNRFVVGSDTKNILKITRRRNNEG